MSRYIAVQHVVRVLRFSASSLLLISKMFYKNYRGDQLYGILSMEQDHERWSLVITLH